MRSLVTSAVESLLTTYDRFWLQAILTDCGIEEGAGNSRFRDSIESYADFLPKRDCDCLTKGINGNLAAVSPVSSVARATDAL